MINSGRIDPRTSIAMCIDKAQPYNYNEDEWASILLLNQTSDNRTSLTFHLLILLFSTANLQ
jgi:hypothetical protein